ncbi:MAG TPA: NRDE family protein [Saprospiraceae bacterium]|nr:NRDE family protein [Saprospiraceae bacterium]
MCTVSYMPTKSGFILTSSRDESKVRKTLPPATYHLHSQDLVFPKDILAGGTWIAASERGQVACLLNGAFDKFESKDTYVVSRGQVLLDYFNYQNASAFIKKLDCSQVAPFTLLMFEPVNEMAIHQLRWDGEQKFIENIDPNTPKLWASATLYDKTQRESRKSWFEQWIKEKSIIDADYLRAFHTSRHTDDVQNDIVMQRDNGLQTVSVTQVQYHAGQLDMQYHDLISGKDSFINIPLCRQVLS